MAIFVSKMVIFVSKILIFYLKNDNFYNILFDKTCVPPFWSYVPTFDNYPLFWKKSFVTLFKFFKKWLFPYEDWGGGSNYEIKGHNPCQIFLTLQTPDPVFNKQKNTCTHTLHSDTSTLRCLSEWSVRMHTPLCSFDRKSSVRKTNCILKSAPNPIKNWSVPAGPGHTSLCTWAYMCEKKSTWKWPRCLVKDPKFCHCFPLFWKFCL